MTSAATILINGNGINIAKIQSPKVMSAQSGADWSSYSATLYMEIIAAPIIIISSMALALRVGGLS